MYGMLIMYVAVCFVLQIPISKGATFFSCAAYKGQRMTVKEKRSRRLPFHYFVFKFLCFQVTRFSDNLEPFPLSRFREEGLRFCSFSFPLLRHFLCFVFSTKSVAVVVASLKISVVVVFIETDAF